MAFESFTCESRLNSIIFICISETVEDRAKVTINCLYKVIHELSNGSKMYDPTISKRDLSVFVAYLREITLARKRGHHGHIISTAT